MDETLPSLGKTLGTTLVVHERNVLEPEVYEEYQRKLSDLGEKARAFPAIFVGGGVLQGEAEISGKLSAAIRQALEDRRANVAVSRRGTKSRGPLLLFKKISAITVIIAGLLDGVNPCAFSTLIFLLSYLAVAGRGRKEILMIGCFFSLAVFLSYLFIGLGFFHLFAAAQSAPVVSGIMKWFFIGVLLIFSGISFYDYFLIRTGKAGKVILQLPSMLKLQIHNSVRNYVRSTMQIAGSFLLGLSVSVFELACTGQVYFPTIAYLARAKREPTGHLYLIFYNLSFIFPLFLVFFFTYLGINSEKITKVFQKNLGKEKICLAFLFLALAGLMMLA